MEGLYNSNLYPEINESKNNGLDFLAGKYVKEQNELNI